MARGDESSLVGSFKSSPYTRLSTAIVLAFLCFMLIGGLVGGLHLAFTQESSSLDELRCIAFLSLWLAGACLMGWLMVWNASPARGDVAAISGAIRQALELRERGAHA